MFRMLGSGTEACMAAIRVARLATGKKNIIKMGGAYHGWSDSLVYALRIPGTAGFDAHGIPRAITQVYPGSLSQQPQVAGSEDSDETDLKDRELPQ